VGSSVDNGEKNPSGLAVVFTPERPVGGILVLADQPSRQVSDRSGEPEASR
jgi:hypothetical protein